ncbi:MAG: disulfide bond formation protein B [Asticcacaulis sp.]|nr:disulfide bond formation protein B [Asticcacaulis sp.]
MTAHKSNRFAKKFMLAFGRWWSITALVISLVMLATAWSFQLFGHLAPCHLCLKQRDIYWIAVGVSLVASVWALFTGAKGPPRVFFVRAVRHLPDRRGSGFLPCRRRTEMVARP